MSSNNTIGDDDEFLSRYNSIGMRNKVTVNLIPKYEFNCARACYVPLAA